MPRSTPIATACLISALVLSPEARADPPEQPNILLIVADDLGIDYVEEYNFPGEEGAPAFTPFLSEMIADGVRFNNAWSNTICSPTRATLQTGRYSFRTGIGTVINPYKNPLPALDLDETTIAEGLPAEYVSGAFGKWHLGFDPLTGGGPSTPVDHGYDVFIGMQGNLGRNDGTGDYTDYDWFGAVAGGPVIGPNQGTVYATTQTTDWAKGFLSTAEPPWFAYVAYHAPHRPLDYPTGGFDLSIPLCDGQVTGDCCEPGVEAKEDLCFRAVIEAMDVEIEELVTNGIPEDQRDDTIVIFVSDNGTAKQTVRLPWTSSIDDAPARDMGKETVYNGGILVPLVFYKFDANLPPETQIVEDLVNTTDLYATVLDFAGVDAGQFPSDSLSLAPYLGGGAPAVPREYAYAEAFLPNEDPDRPVSDFCSVRRTLRNTRFKLIQRRARNDPSAMEELYELLDENGLGVDLFEQNDLLLSPLSSTAAAAYAELRAELANLTGSEEPITNTDLCEDPPAVVPVSEGASK